MGQARRLQLRGQSRFRPLMGNPHRVPFSSVVLTEPVPCEKFIGGREEPSSGAPVTRERAHYLMTVWRSIPETDNHVTRLNQCAASAMREEERACRRPPIGFPQLRALGRSPTANFYGIGSLDEAQAYLRHPVLAERLARAVDAVLGIPNRSAHEIFGSPDDLKFRSSMTLFSAASDGEESEPFRLALQRFFSGEPDPRTLELLGGGID